MHFIPVDYYYITKSDCKIGNLSSIFQNIEINFPQFHIKPAAFAKHKEIHKKNIPLVHAD